MLTCAEMKVLEERAFAEGVSAEGLMEEAGAQIAAAVRQFFPKPGRCLAYFGKGHNGGDALVAARHLAAAGWNIALPDTFAESDWSPLTTKKYRELLRSDLAGGGHDPQSLILLDGLLGIGAGGALREPIKRQAQAINATRAASNARVFAIDIPTGLNADTGVADADTVIADYTLAIGAAKTGLLADSATRFVGRLAVLPLRELTGRMDPAPAGQIATPAVLAPLLPRRHFDMHKGQCGRVAIVAGSPGMVGAAVMCAEAAVHAGAGLVTLYVAATIEPFVDARITPEVMVWPFTSIRDLLDAGHDALAIGPGLGRSRDNEVHQLAGVAPLPMVLDADALTGLAPRLGVLWSAAGPRLLTPHPGEMERLDPEAAGLSRRETAEQFTARVPVTLLLKGARTIVANRNKPLSYNTTGSPGMATGGMGDVLTGVCVALAGQGIGMYDAARLGAWLCGRAAELALLTRESEESLSATHVIAHLGGAFRALRAGGF